MQKFFNFLFIVVGGFCFVVCSGLLALLLPEIKDNAGVYAIINVFSWLTFFKIIRFELLINILFELIKNNKLRRYQIELLEQEYYDKLENQNEENDD